MPYDFAKRMCTGFISLIRAKALRFRDWLNAVLGESETRGKYLGGVIVRVGKDEHSMSFGNEGSDEELNARTSSREGGDLIDFVVPP